MLNFLLPLLALWANAAPPADDPASVRARADALVSVSFVLKDGDDETQSECYGLLVDHSGIVVCPNSRLGGKSQAISQMMAAMQQDISIEVRDIKVVIGNDGDEVPAELISRDGELDLAWLKLSTPPPADAAVADLKDLTTPKLGQRLFALARAGRFLGRPALLVSTQLGGFVKTPRRLLLCTLRFNEPGVPVFDAQGHFVGMTVLQIPEVDLAGGPDIAMMNLSQQLQTAGMMVLPGDTIAQATTQALQAAATRPSSSPASEPAAKTPTK